MSCDNLDRCFPSSGTNNLTYAKASLLNLSIKNTVLCYTGMFHTTKNALWAKKNELFSEELQDLHNNTATKMIKTWMKKPSVGNRKQLNHKRLELMMVNSQKTAGHYNQSWLCI
jgi:hypothetical protein